jgi:hypothetical protein
MDRQGTIGTDANSLPLDSSSRIKETTAAGGQIACCSRNEEVLQYVPSIYERDGYLILINHDGDWPLMKPPGGTATAKELPANPNVGLAAVTRECQRRG